MADLISEQSKQQQQQHHHHQTIDETHTMEHTTNAMEAAGQTNENGSPLNETENVNIFEQLPSQAAPTPTPSAAMVFMKIQLKESDDILLFENNSYTVLRDTTSSSNNHNTASDALDTNERPSNTTIPFGAAATATATTATIHGTVRMMMMMMDKEQNQRKTNTVETQTVDAHYKTRAINTNHIEKSMAGTFVSNYDMHDTYANLEHTTQCIQIDYGDDRHEQLDITTYTRDGCNDLSQELETSKSFQLSSMILQRVLAGNIYHAYQRRFRNMHQPKSLEPVVNYLYRLQLLYRYRYHHGTAGNAVSCMSWCPKNTDILAIGYGVFKYQACIERERSAVCLWNIKNPVNPERYFKYTVPVTAVSFSHENSQLLAIGFYDGSIRIIDITIADGSNLVAISERKTSPPIEPVWQMKWIKSRGDDNGGNSTNVHDGCEELLTISQDGFVMLYTITNSTLLIGSRQMQIFLNESKNIQILANRFAALLTLEMHPIKSTLYYVGTGDGIIHECSIYDSFQHKNYKHVHKYGVYSMEFSPWSPKIFLTCGFDWYVRIWIEDIDEPIIELRNGFEPIKCASWCPTNSTIIACTTATSLNIWDLRTNCLLPAAVHRFNERNSDNNNYAMAGDLTICYFTNCGQSIVVGTTDGSAYVFALEDMPFAPHHQYDALQEAITRSLVSKPELKRKIKQLGFLGY